MKLTEREKQILELVVLGLDNQTIGAKLNISFHTVKSHLEDMYLRFNVHNKVQLIVFAVANGYLSLDEIKNLVKEF